MFLMKVIQKIRFALVIENEIFYINGSETPERDCVSVSCSIYFGGCILYYNQQEETKTEF